MIETELDNLDLKPKETLPSLENFDWDDYHNENKIFRYRDRENYNLSKRQIELLSLYDGKDFISASNIHEGTVIKGTLSSINKNDIVVDINYKDSVYIDNKNSEYNIVSHLAIGDPIDVYIKEVVDHPFHIKGSFSESLKLKVNEKFSECYTNNTPLVGVVTNIIPAGYMINIVIDKVDISVFMPNTLADVNKLYDPTTLLNKEITVMIETLEQEEGVFVVSRKKYLETLIPEKIKSLKYNKLYEGYVTGTTPFGVFVQFEGCLTGMIHKVNICEEYREKIHTIKAGTLIECYVKDITKTKKIILTQILKESLWDVIKVGQVIEGTVVAIKPFGALVSLDYETSGLIQTNHIVKYKKNLNLGDKLNVKILSILRDDRKINLTFADVKRDE